VHLRRHHYKTRNVQLLAIFAAVHLSKMPRRLQDLSNTTGNPNKKNPTQKKPVPVVSNSTPPLGVHHHHSFKYGDIVGIVNPSSSPPPRNVIAAGSHPAAVQYRPPPTLAMVVRLVDPHTVRIVYPNQVQAHVPIHQIQLVKPMPVMPMMPVVVAGNNSNNKVASKTGK
jgi:hypothetical protein